MNTIAKDILAQFLPLDLDQMRPAGFHKIRSKAIKESCESVKNGKGWFHVQHCPCCGSPKQNNVMEKEGIRIVQCCQCSLGFSSYFPIDTKDVYCDSGYLVQAQQGYLKNVEYRIQRFAQERIEILDKWSSDNVGEKRLLDIGCGTGWFLEFAREHGYKVYGHELGVNLARFTSERLGIPIWTGDLEEIDDSLGFDAITLFDVLEHSPDPVRLMASVKRLLKKNGSVVVFVPNLVSLGFSLLQHNSALVSPAEHLLYFTQKSMQEVAKRSGLEIVDFQTKGMDIPDIIAYYRDELKNEQVANFLHQNIDILQMMIDKSGLANHMRFIFRLPRD